MELLPLCIFKVMIHTDMYGRKRWLLDFFFAQYILAKKKKIINNEVKFLGIRPGYPVKF